MTVTIGERRRQVERVLYITSAIPPTPPSGIPFSVAKLLSIIVLVYSFTLILDAARNKDVSLSLPSSEYLGEKSPFLLLPWQALNIFLSVMLVVGTFMRSSPIVLTWILYAIGAGVYLAATVPIQIINNGVSSVPLINVITILLLTITLRIYWKFFKEIHEDAQPDPEWDIYSRILNRHTILNGDTLEKNKKNTYPAPANPDVV